jgi:hypothetical protein
MVLRSTIPPVGPAMSLITSAFWSGVWTVNPGTAGGTVRAMEGTSPVDPQKQPTQIG